MRQTKLRKRNKKRKIWRIFAILICAGVFVAVAASAYAVYLYKTLPNPSSIGDRVITQSTKIYDRTGENLLYEIHGEENRTVVALKDLPDYVKQATIAIEDEGFYQHPAFDWRGIVRALFVNLKTGKVTQGGSTITQQYIKKAFLSDERTITRKIKEIILAIKLERNYSKDQILEFYLNQIPYGSNAYGVEAASQTYFNKDAKDLT
ncbi:MAG TPA: biosynthetic peptidoglycan transglycosylase, partial [Candidatus Paceibacterota bacterium]|nr:biosynthetic peptidoglycan transglycosylase [Candidatus Paceibacterota bacterium]